MQSIDLASRVRSGFAHARFPVVAAVAALLLSLPALWQGLRGDDYHHRAAILGSRVGGYMLRGDIAHLYAFADGEPEHTQALGDAGHVPWWYDPEARLAFFRPLSALSQRIDYWLWPDSPGIMHAHSLAWLLAVVLAAGAFYRRLFGAVSVAGFALLLFAFDDAHATPASWLAQRNMLLAVFFGTLALVAHHRLRADGWRPGALAAPGLLAMALLAGEGGVTTLAYLVAYAVCIESRPWPNRAASLLPYVGLVVLWRFGTQVAGYGVANIDFYMDPGRDPLRFMGAVAHRLPISFLGLFTPFESATVLFVSPGTAKLLSGIGLGVMALVTGLLWPLLRRDALARFFALATLLSLVPGCATYPDNRLLMWSGIGAMGLIARFLAAFFARDATLLPLSRVHRLVATPFALALAVAHLVLAPIQKPQAIAGSSVLRAQLFVPPLNEPALTRQSVVVVNGPLVFFASHFQVMQDAAGLPVPKHVRILSPSFAAVELDRPDERTLVVRPVGGYLTYPFDLLYRSRRKPLPVGHRVPLPNVTIEVLSLTPDARPAAIACRFSVPLEDASLRWIFWEKGRYRSWTPPPLRGSARLPPAVPLM